MRIVLLTIATCWLQISVWGQQKDSLVQILPETSGEERIEVLHELLVTEWLTNPDKALEYGEEALQLSKDRSDSLNISKSMRLLSGISYYKGDYDQSLELNMQALKLAEMLNDSSLINNSYNNLGLLYFELGSYETSLEYFLRCKAMKNQIGEVYGVGITMVNIGRVYERVGDVEKARTYYDDALEIAINNNHQAEIYALNNKGISYLNQNQYEEAVTFFQKALKSAKELKNSNWGSVSLRGIGEAFMYLGNLDSAGIYCQKSLELSLSIDDKKGISEAYYVLAKYELKMNHGNQALAYLEQGNKIARNIKLRKQQLDNLLLYVDIHKKLNRQDQVVNYQEAYIHLSDSLFKDAVSRNLSFIPLKLKEENESSLLTLQDVLLDKQKLENRLYVIILFITVPFILVLIYLLSKIRKSHEELMTYNDELKKTQKLLISSEKMASLGVMSMGIAHEINNPLNFIKNGVEALDSRIMEEFPQKREELEPLLKIVREGVKRSTEIVRSLSHFSRKTPSMEEECYIKDIIENCLLILHNKIKNKVGIITSFVENGAVKGNEGRLHQAMLNILANAVQAIEQKGTLNIITAKKGNKLEVTIEDDGIGIPEKNLSKISDPFFTTKPPGEGTGLGLFITFSIIQEHGGEIEVISNPGNGTIFIITLPLLES